MPGAVSSVIPVLAKPMTVICANDFWAAVANDFWAAAANGFWAAVEAHPARPPTVRQAISVIAAVCPGRLIFKCPLYRCRDRRSEVPGWEDILERVVVVGGGGRAAAAALGVGAEVVEPVVGAGFLGGAVRAGDGVEPAERVVVVGAGLPAGPATPR